MPTIMELFAQNEVLNYVRDREYKPLLGESLFLNANNLL